MKNWKENLAIIGTIAIIIVIIGLGLAWTIWQWQMCRTIMPFWYCVQHIG
jgi:hypothetical protein